LAVAGAAAFEFEGEPAVNVVPAVYSTTLPAVPVPTVISDLSLLRLTTLPLNRPCFAAALKPAARARENTIPPAAGIDLRIARIEMLLSTCGAS
jgi:hypothetical protein